MTEKEWDEELKKVFPDEVLGFIRPKEGIDTNLPFNIYFPQVLPKDPAVNVVINMILTRILSNDKNLKSLIEEIKEQLSNCDLRTATQILKGLMSAADKKKLDGIADGATKYSHPATHQAKMIEQDGTHRFVTDTEKSSWNGKASANHGNHVPATQTADNSRFLRNDNTWQSVTPSGIGAAPATHTHNYAGSATAGGVANSAKDADTLDGYHESAFMRAGIVNISTSDWNTVTRAGCYDVGAETPFSESLHQPVDAYTYGVLLVSKGALNAGISQLYLAHNNSEIWCRAGYANAAWQEWKCLFRNGMASWASKAVNTDTVDGKHAVDFAPAGFGLGTEAISVTEAINMKTFLSRSSTQDGFYRSGSITDLPNSDGYTLDVRRVNSSYVTVTACNVSWSATFRGNLSNGNWSGWTKIATVNDLPSLVSTNSDGLCPQRNGVATTYLNGQGQWTTPPDTKYTHPNTHPASMITGLSDFIESQFSQSFAQNGWCRLPNKLILQWGYASERGRINFPISFKTDCYFVIPIIYNPSNNSDIEVISKDKDIAGFTYDARSNKPCLYFALGR